MAKNLKQDVKDEIREMAALGIISKAKAKRACARADSDTSVDWTTTNARSSELADLFITLA